MKRKYTNLKAVENRIIEMRSSGKTRQEIADELGFTKQQIKDWISRYNKRIAFDVSRLPKTRGRKPAVTLSEYKYENKRLKMENELLRDFLHLSGKG
jgi:transposase